ncbi:HAMP domain-containing protein [Dactylosporangium sp. McL0621]|uniref:HAMP domain-containing sensor histidine kinase n=1 Tax=Dactylosporangium sp. McL0621 TaxID=3415678 RepID=UPI003CF90899
MLSRLGLRFRMATSYVLVSAAAVLLVEAAALALVVPRLQAADLAAAQARKRAVVAEQSLGRLRTQAIARNLAAAAGSASSVAGGGDGDAVLARVAAPSFAAVATTQGDEGVVQVVAGADGRVAAAAPTSGFPDAMVPEEARGGEAHDGQVHQAGGISYWASAPIRVTGADGTAPRVIGTAYVVMTPTGAGGEGQQSDKQLAGQPDRGAGDPAGGTTVQTFALPGIIALVLLLPVGALFGLLSTGPLIRRIRRLAEGTSAMADGDLQVRIPVSGGDEVGRLEHAFNSMAERLDAAVVEQKATAGAEARRAERTRIARELHDSISQELFSASMVAAGLAKALPAESALRGQAASMEQSLARTMWEMRALLLELRPIALEDAGLVAALEQLGRTYEARLGVPIDVRLDPVALDAAVEHAVLRVAQESIGNAIRHGDPSAIELRLAEAGSRVELTVRDDGRGFDPAAGGRHGMGLDVMRERVEELGGTVVVDSTPGGGGTTVRVSLPVRVASPVA